MSAKWLAGLVVSVAVLIANGFAQVNELSATVGRTFVSTQTIQNSTSSNPHIHFGNEESFAFNYGRLMKSWGIFGLRAELPVAIYPRMDLNTRANVIPADIGALFVTPSLRVNFFSGQAVSPWVSAGGGYGRFRVAPRLNFFGANPGSGSNTGVIQFGAGLDVWPWRSWGFRLEARDFYSGHPDLNVTTLNSRQHNYYVGVGGIFRF